MTIRKAFESDIHDIERLLVQICTVHSEGRPDLFKNGGQKYNYDEIKAIINDENRPVIVAYDEEKKYVIGYAMCVFQTVKDSTALCDMKTLYLDDLCVDGNFRGNGIGKQIYDYVVDFAKKSGCYNLTLNVWECNEGAKRFYERCGLVTQKTTLEKIL